MPRVCTICAHNRRSRIETAIAHQESLRSIANHFRVTHYSLRRHRDNCIPEAVSQEREAARHLLTVGLDAELERCFRRINKVFDACDQYLRDADNPDRYSLDPRAEDVSVIYHDQADTNARGEPRRKRARLSRLLALAANGSLDIERVEWRIADPRELILKSASQLHQHLDMLAKLRGSISASDPKQFDDDERSHSPHH